VIISISGIDSAGKSTQIELLRKDFEEKNYSYCIKWSKARATPGVVFLKSIFRRDKKMNYAEKMEHREEVFQDKKKKTLLLFASIVDLCFYWGIYFRVLEYKKKYLIFDRYLWDTYVEIKSDFYGIDFEKWFVWKLLVKVTPKPDVSIILVVPVEVSLSRDINKTDITVENPAVIDSKEKKIEKLESYYKLIEDNKWDHVIDGTKTVEEVHNELLSKIEF
jgi:dTMP kinase